ncbi:MarR family winged helix-turn-helix transcriptional regulator [Conexibacter sp. SYSU D00693]|uniref:MarR family winged helix-turn-helix transcriptional regulator n=1 Tax=Conexibacter sp. SYSU D00693 TaxID=2812560 RepID=UPI00196AFE65
MAASAHTTGSQSAAPLLDHLARLTRARSEAVLGKLGLRPRHLVCLTVLRDHGEVSQQDLASVLRMDRTNLVGLLNELEEQELIARRRSKEDRRRHVVGLTTAGERRLRKAEAALGDVEDEVLGALDADERATLYRLLRQATGSHMDCAAAVVEAQADGDDAC